MKVRARRFNCIYSCLFNNKGFTLIEIIVVLALIGIISSMAFSVNIFGIKVFNKGSDRYDLNSEANLASEYITKYIRFAYGVEILDASYTIPDSAAILASSTPNDAYIYVNDDSGKKVINYIDKDSTKTLGQFDTCTLLVNSAELDKSLNFSITASVKDENYSVDSGIVPINLLIQSNPKITGVADGIAIKIINDSPTPVAGGTLTFEPINPPNGTVDSAYNAPGYNLSASDGTPSYTFTVSSSARLPYGMTLSASGELGGTPKESGIFSVGVRVFDSSTPTKSATNFFIITIDNNVAVNSNAPMASNVRIDGPESIQTDGTAAVGSLLTVNYDFSDVETGESELGSTYTWYRGNSANGTGMVEILGVTSKTYTPASGDINKYIFVKVIPKSTDTSEGAGTAVFCQYPVQIVTGTPATKPVAKDVKITKSGNVLTGNYTYVGSLEGATIFKWYSDIQANGSSKVEIIGEIHQTLTLTGNTYKDKYLFFEVIPKASDGTLGDGVMSSNYFFNNSLIDIN